MEALQQRASTRILDLNSSLFAKGLVNGERYTSSMKWIACVSVFLFVDLAFSQALDPGGWGKAKWGMTVQQIKVVYPDAKWNNNGLVLRDFLIDGMHFDVEFESPGPAGLMAVDLQPTGEKHTRAKVYSKKFLQKLTDEYGPPSWGKLKEPDGGITREVIWIFTASLIRVLYMESPVTETKTFAVQYHKHRPVETL